MILRYALCSCWLGASLFGQLAAVQSEAPVPVGPAHAILSKPFTLIKGLRELADGRVLVTDWIEGRVVLVDFHADTQRDLGREGAGPNEFRLPGRLVAVPGDSTMLVDVGNARLTVIGPDLNFVRSISTREHGERYAMNPRAVDRRGILYFEISPFAVATAQIRADSVPIAHWGVDYPAVRFIPGLLLKTSTGRPSGPSMGLPYVPFAKQDGWAAASDGWLAVVRSEPYRVEWYGPQGERVIGEEIPYRQRAVTMQDRRDHVRRFLASSMQSGRGEGGGMGLMPAEAQSPRETDRIARTGTFAEEFPPFEPDGIWISGEKLWVQRSLPHDSAPTFDVVDRTGARTHTFSLASGRRVVGFGSRYLYAVSSSEFDLLTLERYPIPAGGR